jgi:cytochrome c-type biogenesis protein
MKPDSREGEVMVSLGDLAVTFWLGVLTPLTALCVIPLYPAFLARLARTVGGTA